MMLDLRFRCSTCTLKHTHTHTSLRPYRPAQIIDSFIHQPMIAETLLYVRPYPRPCEYSKQKTTQGLLGSHFLLGVTSNKLERKNKFR